MAIPHGAILELCAFISFVLAAAGVPLARVNLIGLGLAFEALARLL
jgi:hypothetical protein